MEETKSIYFGISPTLIRGDAQSPVHKTNKTFGPPHEKAFRAENFTGFEENSLKIAYISGFE
ncbi:MAG: hypothetical protein ACHQNE_10065 [Candidatus Kapaibacterium sp.]